MVYFYKQYLIIYSDLSKDYTVYLPNGLVFKGAESLTISRMMIDLCGEVSQ